MAASEELLAKCNPVLVQPGARFRPHEGFPRNSSPVPGGMKRWAALGPSHWVVPPVSQEDKPDWPISHMRKLGPRERK